MPSPERSHQSKNNLLENLRQEFSLLTIIALGSFALVQMARKPPVDPKDVASYPTLRATELEVDGYAKQLQREGSKAAGRAVDSLGQDLSGIRGEMEDRLDEAGYFDKK